MTAKNKRRFRWPLIVVVAIVVALVVALLVLSRRSAQDDWRQSYRSALVEAIAFQDSVEVSGNIEPLAARDLAFPVAGKVIEVAASEGQSVSRGSLLARLDDRVARYELAAVQATLEQKRLDGSARELRLLELERDIKAQAVADHELRSPLDGRVSFLAVQAGDFVAEGRGVARVVDISSLKARVQIDELDAPAVKEGQPVRFTFDALPDLDISGRVSALELEGRITSEGLTVVDGEVMIANPPPELLVGYSFTGEILLGEEETVLAVPEMAVMRKGDQTYVYLLPEGDEEPVVRNVSAQVLDDERIQVVSGLAEGERILVPLVSQSGREPGATLTTQGLLKSLRRRARVPFLGGEQQSEDR